MKYSRNLEITILALIILLAVFLRFWNLGAWKLPLYDEVITIEHIQGGYKPRYISIGGSDIFLFIVGGITSLFSEKLIAYRISTSILLVISAAIFYFAVKMSVNRKWIAPLAALGMVLIPQFINLRFFLEQPLSVFLLSVFFYLLSRWYEKRNDYLIIFAIPIFFAFGLYNYFTILFVILPFYLFILYKILIGKLGVKVLVGLLLFLILTLPWWANLFNFERTVKEIEKRGGEAKKLESYSAGKQYINSLLSFFHLKNILPVTYILAFPLLLNILIGGDWMKISGFLFYGLLFFAGIFVVILPSLPKGYLHRIFFILPLLLIFLCSKAIDSFYKSYKLLLVIPVIILLIYPVIWQIKPIFENKYSENNIEGLPRGEKLYIEEYSYKNLNYSKIPISEFNYKRYEKCFSDNRNYIKRKARKPGNWIILSNKRCSLFEDNSLREKINIYRIDEIKFIINSNASQNLVGLFERNLKHK